MSRRAVAVPVLVCALGLLAAPGASAQGGDCLTADPPAPEPGRIDFGITPGLAGSAGVGQGTAVPVDRRAERAALTRLEPPRRDLVLRLNRLFWDGGGELIRKFGHRVDRYARAGLASEIQGSLPPA